MQKRSLWVVLGIAVGVAIAPPVYKSLHSLEKEAVASSSATEPRDPAAKNATNGTSSTEGALLKRSSESFRAVAKKVGPAVVVIKTTVGEKPRPGRRRQQPGRPPEGFDPFQDDPFFDFFRRFGGPHQFPPPNLAPQTGLGSGFVIDKKGYIVTNNHVVENASKIVVTLPGDEKSELKAKVIGTDPRSDLAVIKIDPPKDIAVVEFADSDQVEVGDWAIAIGSPFMLTHSVTAGIISAKGRSSSALMGSEYGFEMLQTDAAINPGNSGGPLCDIEGKVVGVNTAIYSRSGGYMGIGFAIPSNVAKQITSTLIAGGKVVRGWLGVVIQPVDESMGQELGIKEGVVVHQVTPDSPAAKAGLKAGDVITEVAGKSVKDSSQVQQLISATKPGNKVELKVKNYENKKARSVTVVVGELPQASQLAAAEGEGESSGQPDRLGIVVAQTPEGVQVQDLLPESGAAQSGLEPGDVIVSIKGARIKTLAEYNKAVKEAKGKRLGLLVKREGKERFVLIPLREQE